MASADGASTARTGAAIAGHVLPLASAGRDLTVSSPLLSMATHVVEGPLRGPVFANAIAVPADLLTWIARTASAIVAMTVRRACDRIAQVCPRARQGGRNMPNGEIEELVELSATTVGRGQVYLDSQNPRLAEIELGEEPAPVPDERVVDPAVQADLLAATEGGPGHRRPGPRIGKLGFLTIDRIVVRPLEGVEDSFVVLEGNRR